MQWTKLPVNIESRIRFITAIDCQRGWGWIKGRDKKKGVWEFQLKPKQEYSGKTYPTAVYTVSAGGRGWLIFYSWRIYACARTHVIYNITIGGTTASRDRHKLLTHQAFAKAISIHFLSRCFETSCVSREAFLACLWSYFIGQAFQIRSPEKAPLLIPENSRQSCWPFVA